MFKKPALAVLCLVVVLLLIASLNGCGGQAGSTGANQPQASATKAKGTIRIGYVDWAEDIAVSNLWKEILEKQGYTVNLQSADVAPLFVGLSKDDLDLFLDAWLPVTHKAYWDKYKKDLQDYGIWYQSPARIGLVVPNYVTINSIDQMNSERSKFNGQVIGIDPGAGIMKAAAKAIKDYGLNFKLIQGSEAAMMAALEKAYRDKNWIVITGWSPHWMFAKFQLKYLSDPKKDFGEAEGLHTLANKDFSTKMPQVAAELKRFKLTDQQIGGLEALINQGMTPQDAAKKWIDENQNVVDSWTKG
ncbi:glycine betaine ABC transporter substrate-binding protein [Acididesulfobacillus acetoxydans]|uniref:glycine betaine ABC transporter substrate-binding protein n=1 Tax=Acididesulfobacillus acetoxydans TaxID=1561005 RepID=UPI0021BF71E8|nr:glycine betaine ABC transporter substrate-binding protein [Acididesulfobacillus acetoxydans]